MLCTEWLPRSKLLRWRAHIERYHRDTHKEIRFLYVTSSLKAMVVPFCHYCLNHRTRMNNVSVGTGLNNKRRENRKRTTQRNRWKWWWVGFVAPFLNRYDACAQTERNDSHNSKKVQAQHSKRKRFIRSSIASSFQQLIQTQASCKCKARQDCWLDCTIIFPDVHFQSRREMRVMSIRV
jgi:hypothetical protein